MSSSNRSHRNISVNISVPKKVMGYQKNLKRVTKRIRDKERTRLIKHTKENCPWRMSDESDLEIGKLYEVKTDGHCWPWITSTFPPGEFLSFRDFDDNVDTVTLSMGEVLMYVGRSDLHIGDDGEPHHVFLWDNVLIEDMWDEFFWNIGKLEQRHNK